MPFAERLAAGRFAVALEITPPQSHLPKVLLRRARFLGEHPHAINVIQRPGRQSSLEASIHLKSMGIEPVWHLVTRGRTRADVRAEIDQAAAAGIRQVLCIRGDHTAGDTAETPTLKECVALVRARMPGALIGATLNQYAPDHEAVLRNLLPKLRAGATYVQTQPVLELETLRPLAERVLEAAPGTRIAAMVMPLLSPEQAVHIAGRLGITLPAGYEARLQTEAAAWEAFEEIVASLTAAKLVAGAAIMNVEMDPPPAVGERILHALRKAACFD